MLALMNHLEPCDETSPAQNRFRDAMTEHRSHIQLEADLAGDIPKRGIKFDATINLGHILTFIGFMLAGFGAWSTLDKRVVILEENRKLQAAIDLAQDNRTAQSTDQITAALAKLDRQIERLTDKLDNAVATRGRGNREVQP